MMKIPSTTSEKLLIEKLLKNICQYDEIFFNNVKSFFEGYKQEPIDSQSLFKLITLHEEVKFFNNYLTKLINTNINTINSLTFPYFDIGKAD